MNVKVIDRRDEKVWQVAHDGKVVRAFGTRAEARAYARLIRKEDNTIDRTIAWLDRKAQRKS